MIRSKAALAVAACLAGVISGSIGAAQADTTGATGASGTAAAAATITVNGAATLSVDSSASTSAVQASYLTALGSALTNAHTKATALSSAVGDTLGAVQNITEQSSDNGGVCYGPTFAAAGTSKGVPVPTVSPGSGKKKKSHGSSKPKAARAIIAEATTSSCTIQADVTVTYAMAPA